MAKQARGKVAKAKLAKKRAVARTTAAAAPAHSGYTAGLTTFDASKARSGFPEIVNRVSYGNEHIAVAKHGDVKVVVIDRAEYERFRAMEDYLDGAEALKALREFEESGEKTISSADVLKRLGLK